MAKALPAVSIPIFAISIAIGGIFGYGKLNQEVANNDKEIQRVEKDHDKDMASTHKKLDKMVDMALKQIEMNAKMQTSLEYIEKEVKK